MICETCQKDTFIIYRFITNNGACLSLCPECKDNEEKLEEYRQKWEKKPDFDGRGIS